MGGAGIGRWKRGRILKNHEKGVPRSQCSSSITVSRRLGGMSSKGEELVEGGFVILSVDYHIAGARKSLGGKA